jgi:hypothetical protein
LIRAFANLAPELFAAEFFPEMAKRFLPRVDVQFVGINECSVDIENYSSDHSGAGTNPSRYIEWRGVRGLVEFRLAIKAP